MTGAGGGAAAAPGAVPPDLPPLLYEPLVRNALLEDLGRAGDLTSDALIPAQVPFHGAIVAREPGVVAGVALAVCAFRLLEPAVTVDVHRADGARVEAGARVLTVTGPARAVLAGERTALNFMTRLSGIASATAGLVAAVRGTGAVIACTRKTTPGLRALEKHAVRLGGGASHRYGLDDAILIKDNHIAVVGDVAEAVARARHYAGHTVRVVVEVDTLEQLRAVLPAAPDVVLLDNMDAATLAEAVRLAGGRVITEASGRMDAASARAAAEAGVDIISVGWITHSAPALDLALDSLPPS